MTRVPGAGLWAAVALIVAVNAVLLGGVAYNRSGTPESALRLTQRELAAPQGFAATRETSGLALRLRHRIADTPPPSSGPAIDRDHAPGVPGWLDEAKLAALGVDVHRLQGREPRRRGGTETSREVLLVLEFDGPAHAQALAQARRRADDEAALVAANPGKDEFAQRAAKAAEAAQREASESSRLFVVDAGLDQDQLRASHPDRQHYAIVRGVIQPLQMRNGKAGAHTVRLAVDEVSVPAEFRAELAAPIAADRERRAGPPRAKYDATVVWGRRLEPWITAARVGG